MKIRKAVIPVLSAGHGLNDMLAGYLLGCIALQQEMLQAATGLLLYNLLAFGGQYPVALWIEKIGGHKRFLTGSYLLNLLAIAVFPLLPQFSVVLTGIASAIYHVAGGAVCARQNKAVHIGLFAAPGVAGLIIGGYFAWTGYHLELFLLPAVAAFFLLLSLLDLPEMRTPKEVASVKPDILPDRHDIIMILLLTVISLRSAVWNIFQLIHEHNYTWLFAIALAAFAGKIAGGWLADRIGWRRYVFISLITAAPLITFVRNEVLLFCIGIGLLQSGIPATTALLIRAVKGKTERGIGLSFGTAIIAGSFAFAFPAGFFTRSTFIPALLILLMTTLMFYSRSRRSVTENS